VHYHLGWLMSRLGKDAAARRHLDGFTAVATQLSGGRVPLLPTPRTEVARPRDAIAHALLRAGRSLRLCAVDAVLSLDPPAKSPSVPAFK
jgi:hypothetical protein